MMMPKKLETSVLHVDENEDNSEIVKRFDLDMNLKP